MNPESGDGNLRRNVGDCLPFGMEFILFDLKSYENLPQVFKTLPTFYPTNQVCCAHNSLPYDTILRPMIPVTNFSVCFFKLHFNIVIFPMLKSSKYCHSFNYVDKNFVSIFCILYPCTFIPRTTCTHIYSY